MFKSPPRAGFLLVALRNHRAVHPEIRLGIAKKRQKLGSRNAKFHRLDYTEDMHELVRDTVFAPLCSTGSDKEDHDDGDLAVAPAKPKLKKLIK